MTPRRRRGDEAVAQCRGQHEVGHMIEGKGALEAVLRDFTLGEHGAGIVDQDINARFRGRYRCSHAIHFGKA